jgi:hypothetical protein
VPLEARSTLSYEIGFDPDQSPWEYHQRCVKLDWRAEESQGGWLHIVDQCKLIKGDVGRWRAWVSGRDFIPPIVLNTIRFSILRGMKLHRIADDQRNWAGFTASPVADIRPRDLLACDGSRPQAALSCLGLTLLGNSGWTQGEAETVAVVPVRRVAPVPVGRPTERGPVAPTAATEHAARACGWTNRIGSRPL